MSARALLIRLGRGIAARTGGAEPFMPDDIDNLIPRAGLHVAEPVPIDAESRARRDP